MFVLHSDVNVYARTIYSSLDFLGDVGGLSDAIRAIGTILIWMFESQGVIAFLIVNLFKQEGSPGR